MKNTNEIIYLESVGSNIDTKTAIVYPAFTNGKSDTNHPMSLLKDDISAEWLDSLSEEDNDTVYKVYMSVKRKDFIKVNKHLTNKF